MLSVNALNLADDGSEGAQSYTVDKDADSRLGPGVHLLDSGGVALVRQDYAAHPDYYAGLSAFNSGRIYQYPSSTSYYDNMEISLANCYFVGSVLYPEALRGGGFRRRSGGDIRLLPRRGGLSGRARGVRRVLRGG